MTHVSEYNDTDHSPITVYYDGSCPMCTAFVQRVDSSAPPAHFDLRNIHDAELPPALDFAAVNQEIHVIRDGHVYRNADAILEILAQYPRWRLLAHLGRLPGIKRLLPVGYNFVAAHRHWLFGPAARLYWLKVMVVVGFLSSILLTIPLWLAERSLPLTPAISRLPEGPPFIHLLLLTGLGLALLTSLILARPRLALGLAAGAAVALFALDQQRLQPWAFQYVSLLALLAYFSWQWRDRAHIDSILNTSRFIVAAIYLWSGV